MLAPPDDLESRLDRAELEPGSSAARLLGCAEELFAARGFDGITTRDVAAAAGVNISTLHFHWVNKKTLYEAVCRLQARQLIRFLEQPPPPPSEEDKLAPSHSRSDRMERWVDRSILFLSEHPAIARMAWQSVSGQSAPDLPTLLRHDVAFFRRFESVLADGLTPGRKRDARLVLLLLFYFVVGIFSDSELQRVLLEGSVYGSPELREQLREFLRRLVGTLASEAQDAGHATR